MHASRRTFALYTLLAHRGARAECRARGAERGAWMGGAWAAGRGARLGGARSGGARGAGGRGEGRGACLEGARGEGRGARGLDCGSRGLGLWITGREARRGRWGAGAEGGVLWKLGTRRRPGSVALGLLARGARDAGAGGTGHGSGCLGLASRGIRPGPGAATAPRRAGRVRWSSP